jgi:glycyl-radical enzyme activating protein
MHSVLSKMKILYVGFVFSLFFHLCHGIRHLVWDAGHSFETAQLKNYALKGYVFDIQKFALHDGPGIRTTVFLKGCELRCTWCCNPESQLLAPQLAFDAQKCTNCLDCVSSCKYGALTAKNSKLNVDFEKCVGCGKCVDECLPSALKVFGYETSATTVVDEVFKDFSYFETSGGGITLSGGDPVFQPEFAFEILKLAKSKGIHTCLETSGHCKPEIIQKLAGVTDLFLFDFKHYKKAEHEKYTNVSNEIILKNLDYLGTGKHSVILRCPIIPGVNDSLQHFETIVAISKKYDSIQAVEVMPFHDWGFHKYKLIGRERPKISSETISKETAAKWKEGLRKLGCSKII